MKHWILTFGMIGMAVGMLFAQNGFRYQAVARDSTGAEIANQLIGVQIGIIQEDINNDPIYQETHTVKSSDYGVINLIVGDGVAISGDFNSVDWSLTSFIQIELDLTGGTNYELSGTSEILSVPKALYAETARYLSGTRFGLHVTDFGAVGDAVTDNTNAFQRAIDSAGVTGAKVFVPAGNYRIIRTLEVPSGVLIIGEGVGSDPLQTPYNGSIIRFEGTTGFAFRFSGHTSGMRDIAILDRSNGAAAGGVLIQADGRLVESSRFFNILISGFTGGTGLKLHSKNAGGIAYASFYNARIRHAKIGIHISQESGGFVNSNNFYHGAVSGGGFDYAMLVDGGNNNTFHGTIFEPIGAMKGHLVVNSGEIQCQDIRLDGTTASSTIPMIHFKQGTRNSHLTGTSAGGLTIDKGNNFIDMRSGKVIHYRNSTINKFRNSTFSGFTGSEIPGWDLTGTGVTMTIQSPVLTAENNVMKITIPAGVTAYLAPKADSRPLIKGLTVYEQVNVGFYVKTTAPDVAYVMTNAPAGWTSSYGYLGGDEWQFLGMTAFVDPNQPLQSKLMIANTTGGTLEVYVTTPVLTFGNQSPTLDPTPLTSAGGQVDGLLSYTMIPYTIPSTGFLDLPKEANYFEITNVKNIHRINYTAANRFPKGSVITLLFNNAGVGVTNGGYIQLKGGYNSVVNGSITLISNGNGTWREISRN